MSANEVVNLRDMTSVSLSAGRKALASGTGSPTQRAMLRAFYSEFDKATQAGQPRQDALDRGLDAMRRLGAEV